MDEDSDASDDGLKGEAKLDLPKAAPPKSNIRRSATQMKPKT